MGQEYSTKVQIIVKADRGKAIAWRSVSCRMTCYHKNSLDSQSAFCTHSAVCCLHFVSVLQSAFCTKRYPWHQYSLSWLQLFAQHTHNLRQNTYVWINSTFSFFSALILFFPFEIMKTPLTMFQEIHPTPQKITLACIVCLCFSLL